MAGSYRRPSLAPPTPAQQLDEVCLRLKDERYSIIWLIYEVLA